MKRVEKKNVVASGVVQKRASRRGLFGTGKWKNKIINVHSGMLVYYNKTAASNAESLAAKSMSLSGCSVKRIPLEGLNILEFQSPVALWLLKTPAREFVFGCSSIDEADEWVALISAEIPMSGPHRSSSSVW